MSESFFDIFVRSINGNSLSVIATILITGVILSVIIVVILVQSKAMPRSIARRFFVLLFSLCVFGGVAGYCGGLSREAAVGDIIPAILALAGGLTAYLFGIDTSRGAIASVGLVAFTVALFFGFSFGADIRADSDHNSQRKQACLDLFYDPSLYTDADALERAAGGGGATLDECKKYWGNS